MVHLLSLNENVLKEVADQYAMCAFIFWNVFKGKHLFRYFSWDYGFSSQKREEEGMHFSLTVHAFLFSYKINFFSQESIALVSYTMLFFLGGMYYLCLYQFP